MTVLDPAVRPSAANHTARIARFTLAKPRLRLDPGLKLALWLLVTLRVGLGLVAVLSIELQAPTFIGGDWLELLLQGGEPWSLFLSTWQRWDALWYQQIAQYGYQLGGGTAAFFPLYPLLARTVALPLGLGGWQTVWAELLVSSAAFVAGLAFLYRLARLDLRPRAARMVVLLTATSPVGFFLLAPYTESLFLALTIAAFWYARTARPWAAGAVGFAAGLTRAQGVLLAPALLVAYLQQRRSGKSRRLDLGLLAAGLPVLGFALFYMYQRRLLATGTEPTAALELWGYTIVPPWEALSASWTHIATRGDIIEGLNLMSLLAFSLMAAVGARTLPLGYTIYVAASLGLLLTREMWLSPLMSVSRYTLVLFPCFIAVAPWLARHPWLANSLVVFGLLLQVTLLIHWVHFGFVA